MADGSQLSLDGHVAMAFPTMVARYPWPNSEALNAELSQVILAEEKTHPGLRRSNVGGWHSAHDFLGRPIPCIRTVHDRARRMASEATRIAGQFGDRKVEWRIRTEGWANVVRRGAYHIIHNHPNFVWSGVYYVNTGAPDPDIPMNGQIEFVDPRPGANMVRPSNLALNPRMLVAPESGTMLIFPSWLQHMVHPFIGSGERISIAFNVLIDVAPDGGLA